MSPKAATIRIRMPWLSALSIALALVVASCLAAYAAEPGQKGSSEAVFVAEIVALMLVGRLLGEAMLRIGQPAVMGQLIGGLLLGPSVFGLLFPDIHHTLFPAQPEQKAMVDAVSQFGILLLLLLTGMETDLKLVRETGRASVLTSLCGIVIPFAFGVALGEILPDSMLPDPDKRLITSLFLGTALSIASVKIVAMVVREMNFLRRTVGQVILASAIIDDSIGWIIVSIIFSLAQHGTVDAAAVATSVLGTLVFLAVSFTVGRRVVFFIIRWVNDTFVSEYAVITAILVIMGLMALTTHAIGVHTVLGAFVAGILVGQSPLLSGHIDEQLRGLITAFFAPVFFGLAGLGADLTILKDSQLLLFTAGLIAIASIGKFSGAFIGAELGGLTRREGLALACGMNARGSTEVIVATIGLSMGALSHDLFTMIVTMAVITTMAMPPSLRWALARLPIRAEERKRLQREEIEDKGFVANLERQLLAVDDSENGQFAARITGLIAGTDAKPTTVLQIRPESENEKEPADVLVQKAAVAARREQMHNEKNEQPIDVDTIVQEKPNTEVVRKEAEKGYDLFVIGLETMAQGREFAPAVTELAAGFDDSLTIVVGRDRHLKEPASGELSILLPVNGTEPTRRAADVAIALARATKAPITAVYVAQRSRAGGRKPRRGVQARHHERQILTDIARVAESYDVEMRTAVLADMEPDAAILQEVEHLGHNLIVMGVGRRPGDKLFFGETAASVLEQSQRSILFIAT